MTEYALYKNGNYPALAGHAVKIIRMDSQSAFVTFLTGKGIGLHLYCPVTEIGPLTKRKPHKKSLLDFAKDSWHLALVA